MNKIYACKPSINPFNRHFLLKNEKTVYANLKIEGFLKSSARYFRNGLSASIEKHGSMRKSLFNIYEHKENKKTKLAFYEFDSLNLLPEGAINFLSGNRFTVKKYKKNCYYVKSDLTQIAKFDSITPNSFLKHRSLKVEVINESNKEQELVIFSVWYMMIIIGMGLNDG